MCGTCGCGQPDQPVLILKPGEEEHMHNYFHSHTHHHGDEAHTHSHSHSYVHAHHTDDKAHVHDHEHQHDPSDHEHQHMHGHVHEGEGMEMHEHHHAHEHQHGRQVMVEEDALHENNLLAERNRGFFEAKKLLALNLVSSPGSGKTSLLEKTIIALKEKVNIYVIEGDQQTMNDAGRIDQAGAPVVQINTGNGCHLDAAMINKALKRLDISDDGILMIENVGNLVCPSLFDLGEALRVVIISVTEGDDKPLKYPTMFETSHICVINKTDLLPYVDFDVEKTREYALRVNPELKFFEVSVKSGEGMEDWFNFLLTEWKKA